MSMTVDSAIPLLHASAASIYSLAETIETTDLGVAIKAATHVFGYADLPALLEKAWVNPVTTTSAAASRVTVFEGRVQLAPDTGELAIVAYGTNMSLLVSVLPSAGGSAIDTDTLTGSGVQTGSLTGITQEDVLLKVELGHDGTSPASLNVLRILGEPLTVQAEFP